MELVYWHWLALGLALIIAETLGAAGFLLALGTAALTTGLLTLILALSWHWQVISFSILSIVLALIWWQVFQQQNKSIPSTLNRPLEAMIGTEVILTQAIINGRGKIHINDAYWEVLGQDLPSGSKVKIIGFHDQRVLLVEPI